MTKSFYENYVVNCSPSDAEDRLRKVLKRISKSAKIGLDIGCGLGRNLALLEAHLSTASLIGIDVAETAVLATKNRGFEAHCVDASDALPFADSTFDFVLCGEVIEHVVQTDNLLLEIARVLKRDGTLVLTTPNLAYLPNRFLLLFGIQPLFTETSQLRNMGRVFEFLGQGRETQGHLKIFTLRALRDLMVSTGWHIDHVEGYRFFQSGPLSIADRIFGMVPDMAAGFVIAATRAPDPS